MLVDYLGEDKVVDWIDNCPERDFCRADFSFPGNSWARITSRRSNDPRIDRRSVKSHKNPASTNSGRHGGLPLAVEAAVRSGQIDKAQRAIADLELRAESSGTFWALGAAGSFESAP
jgi:hypothetical protein